ncbi:MAG: glycoside hydrolase family 92 protein [Actinobacteria bacterium]|nr:glycoside hydrolase family 92 protein [Actinomycetota bacterium]
MAGAQACILAAAAPGFASPDSTPLVDPFVGTAGAGNTFPGAVVPSGMVQFSPVSARTSTPGGYRYDDATIGGFALTRLSGAGCTNMGDLPVLPLAQPFAALSSDGRVPPGSFRHTHESASPGRYTVRFDSGVSADLTATLRTGDATFTFPGPNGYVVLDAGGGGAPRNGISIELVSKNEVRGSVTESGFCGGPASPTLNFDVRFDRPVGTTASWGQDGTVVAGVAKRKTTTSGGLLLGFAGGTVRMKVGVSYVSVANAALNLRRESPGWDFRRVANDARSAWSTALGRIEVRGGGAAAARTFYTALYHSLIHPTVASDVNGQFRRKDGKVGRATGYTRLTNISGWDVYRTQIPLLALVEPTIGDDLVRSMVAGAAESGSMAKWEYAGFETGTMVGDPAAPIVAGVDAFGDHRIDRGSATAALERAALRTDPGPFMYPSNLIPTDGSAFGPFVERPALVDYIALGYVPYDLREGGIWGTASTTLEYGIADFALSRLLGAGRRAAASTALLARSGAWRNLFDPVSRYIEPRNADGSFLPSYSDVSKLGFVEGNAMQYTWSVPYDVAGLFRAIGPRAATERLDSMLTRLNTDRYAPNAWLGNEPSFDLPWLYLWLREPWKTQAAVRRATTTLFGGTPAGLPGNDDLGALSAWYVWSALGLYPAIPGVGGFAVGSPTFASATIHAGLRTISLEARGRGAYVKRLDVNGAPASRTWVALPRRASLSLQFTRAERPQSWGAGAASAPPSFAARQPARK